MVKLSSRCAAAPAQEGPAVGKNSTPWILLGGVDPKLPYRDELSIVGHHVLGTAKSYMAFLSGFFSRGPFICF